MSALGDVARLMGIHVRLTAVIGLVPMMNEDEGFRKTKKNVEITYAGQREHEKQPGYSWVSLTLSVRTMVEQPSFGKRTWRNR